MSSAIFQLKQFAIRQDRCALKVGTDGLLLGGWTNYEGARRILDIGTGTGLLALIAAQRNATAHIDAVEIDDASAEQAKENVEASPWRDRVRVHRMDVRKMKPSGSYDLITCNPPFYAGEMDSPDDRKALAKHGGELTFAELMNAIDHVLTGDGRASLIVPTNRVKEMIGGAERAGLRMARRSTVRYLASRPPKRVLLELRRQADRSEDEDITVEVSAGGNYSKEYRGLLSDLMLKF